MKRSNYLFFALLMALTTSCSDDVSDMSDNVPKPDSRVAYDYPPVEWDNVDGIQVCLNNDPLTTTLPVPWAPGTASVGSSLGSWTDSEYKNPDSKKRAYSRENGWEMTFHNLMSPNEKFKYFGLYNRFTGVLRMFFYEIGTSTQSSTYSWTSFSVNGSSSLLNFANRLPQAMSEKIMNPCFAMSSKGIINNKSGNGYMANKWFALEVELAYDADATSGNTISASLWGENTSQLSLSGTNQGAITGAIQTVFSNSLSGNNLNFSFKGGDHNVNVTENEAKEILESESESGKKLINKIVDKIPGLIEGGLKAGLNYLFSGGATIVTSALSKILGLSGRSTTPMSATSKVDLGVNSNITLNGSISATILGWGYIQPFKLPEFGANGNQFSGKLGVWNFRDYPKVMVDLLMTSMYYPKELVPNPSRPQACYPTFSFTLSPAELVINPDLLIDYKVENLSQTLVYTSTARTTYATVEETGEEYGFYASTEFYKPSTLNLLKIKGMGKNLFNNWNPNNIEDSYSIYWSGYDKPMTDNQIMCHVYFELVSKTDSNERYAYSKYFPCKAVKGKFSHREETING